MNASMKDVFYPPTRALSALFLCLSLIAATGHSLGGFCLLWQSKMKILVSVMRMVIMVQAIALMQIYLKKRPNL